MNSSKHQAQGNEQQAHTEERPSQSDEHQAEKLIWKKSTTIGKSRVARDSIAMHTSWRSNGDIACATSIGYPCTRASNKSSTMKYRLLHASGPHPIPPPDNPNGVGKRVKVRHLSCRDSMMFRVVRTNLYNQDLGLNPLDK
ncbi:hypothetical protein F511_33305 [Dorcoceras hygrometricum]|uniref:Uncharacterized protein n=1 Tax=Dorcoceras hygrometricum TaxID=472368 RepID=A0A2Z7BXT2_9LAMI|nr:hypothetical protein F511_33305 [Dorcoceras hygrometricum]